MVPFMTVDYNEGQLDNLDYRGIKLLVGGVEVKLANSGDFADDYNEILKFANENYPGLPVMGSSSIDHYISDANLDLVWETS